MKLKKYLKEGYTTRSLMDHIPPAFVSNQKLVVGQKNKINKDLQVLLKPTYFGSIPLDGMFKILEKHGLVPLQEDMTYWSGILTGGVKKTEMVHFNLGWKQMPKKDIKARGFEGDKITYPNPDGRYFAVPNAVLTMTYYKMPQSGNYEVIAYVS